MSYRASVVGAITPAARASRKWRSIPMSRRKAAPPPILMASLVTSSLLLTPALFFVSRANSQSAIEADEDAAGAHFQFHREIAAATQNSHYAAFMDSLSPGVIPRARLAHGSESKAGRVAYLKRVHQEHESIYNAIRNQDTDSARAAIRPHLSNSRDRLRKSETQAD